MTSTRTEHDYLGTKQVPSSAYWGVQTERALETYRISGLRVDPLLIASLAQIKIAAARANAKAGVLDKKLAVVIEKAAGEILIGHHHEQFPLDAFQSGAGTATHMNVNEVVANRANELLGKKRGDYNPVHPNDHVNMGQSTNDVYPTAMRLAAVHLVREELLIVLAHLEHSIAAKAKEFSRVRKAARTHLQDAVPMHLGDEFSAWTAVVHKAHRRIEATLPELCEVGLGGTAAGTGLNAHPKYRKLVVPELAKITRLPLKQAANMFSAMDSMAPFSSLSGEVRNLCLELTKIGNDLRLLTSGPTTGFSEITLPTVQPGSSIMPGKINPSVVECMQMASFHAIGCDAAVCYAAQAGQLELNVMMPLIAHELLSSIRILSSAVRTFDSLCVHGIAADNKQCERYLHSTVALATILNPVIGYEKAAEVAKEAVREKKTIREVVIARKLMTGAEFDRLLDRQFR